MQYPGGRGSKRRGIALDALALVACIGCADTAPEKSAVSAELRAESVAKLREVMQTQERWVKVHAAEWLLELDYPEGVAEEFRQELAEHSDEPKYRIGIWRVLAKVPQSEKDKEEWIDKIRAAYADPSSADRVHATETLAKLGALLDEEELRSVSDAAKSADPRLAAYSRWLVVGADKDHRETNLNNLIELLESPEVEARRISAYALQQLGPLDEANWSKVVDKAKVESDPLTKIRLQGTALIAAPETADKSELDSIRDDVLQTATQADSQLHSEVVRILADVGEVGDIELLERHLRPAASPDSQDAAQISATVDLSAAAANAILRIDQRGKD